MSSKMKNKNKSTKFPVARIKKIMQKDEEVGKVAQATPIVISKALELFLNLIIEESHKVTAERGSRKVEAYHLKHAVETVEMLDFLKELVEAVPDPSAGGTIDLEAENTESKKRRGKGKRGAAGAAAAGASSAGEGDGAPKKRRRKKAAAVATPAVPAKNEDEEEDGRGFRGRGRIVGAGRPEMPDDDDQERDDDPDAEMNEYDDEEDGPNHHSDNNYQGRGGSSEDDGWDGDKPFVPGRR